MATCKFFKPGWNNYCTAKGRDERVPASHVKTYCDGWSANHEKCPAYKAASSGSICFITTACVTSLGCPDDGYELTAFRKFRDKWLKLQPNGVSVIEKYYAVAPQSTRKRIIFEFISGFMTFSSHPVLH